MSNSGKIYNCDICGNRWLSDDRSHPELRVVQYIYWTARKFPTKESNSQDFYDLCRPCSLEFESLLDRLKSKVRSP